MTVTSWVDDAELAALFLRDFREQGLRPGDIVVLADQPARFGAVLMALLCARCCLATDGILHQLRRTGELADRRVWRATPDVRADVPERPLMVRPRREAVAAPARVSPAEIAEWGALDVALLQHTSGSTGDPKFVVKSGDVVLRNTAATVRMLQYDADDVMAPLLPLTYQYGLSILFARTMAGSSLSILPFRRCKSLARGLAADRVTIVDAIPGIYAEMLRWVRGNNPVADSPAGVRLWCTGGAPLPSTTRAIVEDWAGAPLLDGYGSTELGNVAFATPDNPSWCGRCIDGVEARIGGPNDPKMTPDQGRCAAAGRAGGGAGDLWVRTPYAMSGYLGGTSLPRVGDWFRTGDIARVHAEGSLEILGRRAAVDRLGYMLHPESIARRATEVAGVEVVVRAVPDDRRGHRLIFYVADPELQPGSRWKRLFCARLTRLEWPDETVVVDRIPLGRSGKCEPMSVTSGRRYSGAVNA